MNTSSLIPPGQLLVTLHAGDDALLDPYDGLDVQNYVRNDELLVLHDVLDVWHGDRPGWSR
jgi:hypothetical protein